MAVLIPDMQMPSWCGECRFCVDNWCYCVPPEKRQPAVSISGKPRWCPLVEIHTRKTPDYILLEEAGMEL